MKEIDKKDVKRDLKKAQKDLKKKLKSESSEFKDFIMKGDVVDLAVGVIVGGAFGKIVTSLVNDILMPFIGILIGGINFTNLSITVANAKIMYGSFIQQVIDFLIISLCVFIFVKIIGGLTKKKTQTTVVEEVKKSEEVILLEEIRDLLKTNIATENDTETNDNIDIIDEKKDE